MKTLQAASGVYQQHFSDGGFMKHFNLVLALLPSLPLWAGEAAYADGSVWTDAKITNIKVVASAPTAPKGYVLVTFAANGSGTPNCASGYPRNVAIDVSSQGGALAFAVLEKAVFGLPLTVTVRGTGACGVVSNADTLASLEEVVANR